MQVPSWRRAGDSGGTWWWLEADCSHFDPACPAQGCQGSRSCLQPPGGGASGKDPLSHPLVRARVWSQRCLATLGGTLSQPRVGFQLGQGERLKVCPPPPPQLPALGRGTALCFCGRRVPPSLPVQPFSVPRHFPGCRWWRPLVRPLAQPLPGNGSQMQTEAGTGVTVSGGDPRGVAQGSGRTGGTVWEAPRPGGGLGTALR